MAGTKNDVLVGKNADFSQVQAPNATTSESNGLVTNGQLWIGSTATNVGGTHINVGTLTSPNGTITVGYSSPNITLDLAGGGEAIDSIAVQTGTSPIVPTVAGLVTINGATVAAGTNPVRTDGTGANTMALEVQISQAIAATDATKIGLSNFNSSQFSVDANGFVSTSGTGVLNTLTGDSGGAISPTAGNINILGGTTGLTFSGAGSTLTLNSPELNLPATSSSSVGVINLGGFNYVHAFGATTNTFIGTLAGNFTVTGSGNTGIGQQSLRAVSSGTRNTCIGYASGFALTTGAKNVLLGQAAGQNYTSSESNNICIGYSVLGTAAESNVLRIGTATGTGDGQLNKAIICGIDGINVGSVATVVTESSNQLGTAVITAGTGISVTPSANAITIAATGSGFAWVDATGATQALSVETGYITDHSATVVYTLPATASLGDTIKIVGKLGLATITPNANQQILIGSTSGQVGVLGTAVSNNVGDCIELVCITAGASTVWRASSVVGTWTVTT